MFEQVLAALARAIDRLVRGLDDRTARAFEPPPSCFGDQRGAPTTCGSAISWISSVSSRSRVVTRSNIGAGGIGLAELRQDRVACVRMSRSANPSHVRSPRRQTRGARRRSAADLPDFGSCSRGRIRVRSARRGSERAATSALVTDPPRGQRGAAREQRRLVVGNRGHFAAPRRRAPATGGRRAICRTRAGLGRELGVVALGDRLEHRRIPSSTSRGSAPQRARERIGCRGSRIVVVIAGRGGELRERRDRAWIADLASAPLPQEVALADRVGGL